MPASLPVQCQASSCILLRDRTDARHSLTLRPERAKSYIALSEEADHETSSDRQWAACDNWCRLCSLRLLLSVSAAEAKSPASRPGFLLPGNSVARLISMPIEIALDNAAIIQYSLKYGKDRCRRGSCRARTG